MRSNQDALGVVWLFGKSSDAGRVDNAEFYLMATNLEIEETGHRNMPVCMAKTQKSPPNTARLRGRPNNEVTLWAGAGFVVANCGKIMAIPGLPASENLLF